MIEVYVKKMDDVWFGVACDDEENVYATMFASDENEALKGLLGSIPFDLPFQRPQKVSVFADRIMALLRDIYDGKDVSHGVRLATKHLSDYTRRVIAFVSLIPIGFVASYGGVAKAAGGGARAVGNVMASNPFAPVVPCHRIVSSDFTLGGYGGGLDAKLAFLKRERRGFSAEREIAVNGRKLRLFPVEFVLRKLEKSKS